MTAPLTLESTRKQIELRLREIEALRHIESLLAELESLQEQVAPVPGEQAPKLTPRELAVARAVAWEGLSVAEIARRQWVSPNTVKSQLKSLYRKLGVHSRWQLPDALRPVERAADIGRALSRPS